MREIYEIDKSLSQNTGETSGLEAIERQQFSLGKGHPERIVYQN